MLEENMKVEIDQEVQNQGVIEQTDRVYKPSYSIEFNREGEVLLYSCDPIKESTVYLKYPYILYESLLPASLYMFLKNPLDLSGTINSVFFFYMSFAWIPRIWYWRSLQYKVHRLYLLRGGKVLKVETNSMAGDRFKNWVETY